MEVHLGQSMGVALRWSAQGLRMVQERQWSSHGCGSNAHLGQTGFLFLLPLSRPLLEGVEAVLGIGVGGLCSGNDAVGLCLEGCAVGLRAGEGACMGGGRGK